MAEEAMAGSGSAVENDSAALDSATIQETIQSLGTLFAEYGLAEATWESPQFSLTLKRSSVALEPGAASVPQMSAPMASAPAAPAGTPISSPMTGVFYAAPSPSSPPFVREGDTVAAGDVVGLIEAMKVFNEITATVSGTVKKLVAESGAVVNPGDPLLYIG